MAGEFSGAMFTGNDTVFAGKSPTTVAIYINKYNPIGILLWNKIIKYNTKEEKILQSQWRTHIQDILPDDAGNLYFTGSFSDSIKMDTFNFYSKNIVAMNGKISFAPVPYFSDSFTYSYSCDSVPYHFNLYNYTPRDSISWDFGDGTISSQVQPVHSYSKAGIYKVTLKVYYKGYDTSLSKIIHYITFPNKLLPNDTTVCNNVSLNLNATIPLVQHYVWQDGDTLPARTVSKDGFYKITASEYGCSKTDSFIFSHDLKNFTLGNDTTICEGNTKALTGPSWQNAVYKWNTGSATQSITINSPGSYKLYVNDGTCNFSDSISIKYGSPPSYYLPTDTTICTGRPIEFIIKDFNGSVLWQDGKTESDYLIHSAILKKNCNTIIKSATLPSR